MGSDKFWESVMLHHEGSVDGFGEIDTSCNIWTARMYPEKALINSENT